MNGKGCINCKHFKDCSSFLCTEYSKWEPIDNIKNPIHYTQTKIETIDIIKSQVDNYKSFLHGNILLAVIDRDYKKAQIYLEWLIKEESE